MAQRVRLMRHTAVGLEETQERTVTVEWFSI